MDDNDNRNDANPANLTGKYDSKGNNRGKGGRLRYKDDDNIKDLHGLYDDPKDNNDDHCDHGDY